MVISPERLHRDFHLTPRASCTILSTCFIVKALIPLFLTILSIDANTSSSFAAGKTITSTLLPGGKGRDFRVKLLSDPTSANFLTAFISNTSGKHTSKYFTACFVTESRQKRVICQWELDFSVAAALDSLWFHSAPVES